MANPIKRDDLANKDVFDNLTDGAKELIKLIDQLTRETKEFGAEAEKVAKGFDFAKTQDITKLNALLEALTKNTENLTKAQKQKKQTEDALSKEEKQRLELLKKLNEAQKANGSENERLRQILLQQKKANRELAQDQIKLTGAYSKQSKTLNQLRKRYKDLAVQNKENTKEGRKLLRNITSLDAKLKAVDASVGQNQRNVGNYSSAFGKLGQVLSKAKGGILAIGAAFAGVTQAVRISLPIFRDYGLAIAKVQAVSGASAREFEQLDSLAKSLGESTAFSASQVAGLELELSKLGFNPQQIIDSTEAILNFAVATDSDLSQAGEAVASTLNAFNLEASEAARVSDIAAKAFSSTALDLDKFQTALSVVGATANASGVSLEETTAVLGTLVDAGIDASTAATGLRKVLAISANENRNYKDVLADIVGDTNQLSKANELFGLTAQSQAVTIANNIDKIEELTDSFNNAEGAAADAANVIGDTLDGDLKRLQSAVEGAILGGEGFEGLLRRVVQFLTKALPPVISFFGDLFNVIGGLATAFKPVIKGLFDIAKGVASLVTTQKEVVTEQQRFINGLNKERFALEGIKRSLSDNNISQQKRSELIKILNDDYGDYLPNLISEEDSYEDIAKAIDKASASLIRRQILVKEQAEISKVIARQVKERETLLVRETELQADIAKETEELADQLKAQDEALGRAERTTEEYISAAENLVKTNEAVTNSISAQEIQLLANQFRELDEQAGDFTVTNEEYLKQAEQALKNNPALANGLFTQSEALNDLSKSASDATEEVSELNETQSKLSGGTAEITKTLGRINDLQKALENTQLAIAAPGTDRAISSLQSKYDKILEIFGLTREELDKSADSTKNLTGENDKLNSSLSDSINLNKSLLDIQRQRNDLLSKEINEREIEIAREQTEELLRIEDQKNADIFAARQKLEKDLRMGVDPETAAQELADSLSDINQKADDAILQSLRNRQDAELELARDTLNQVIEAKNKELEEFKKAEEEKVRNFKSKSEDQKAAKAEEANFKIESDLRVKNRTQQIDNEILLAKESLAQKELALDQTVNEQAEKLAQKRIDSEREGLKTTTELAKESLDALGRVVQEGSQLINDILNSISEKRLQALDNELATINRREDQLKQAFDEGSKFADKSLTKLDERREEIAEEREREIRQQAQRELFLAGVSVLAQTGNIEETLRQLGQLKLAIPALIPQFHDGGYTGDGGEWDAIPALLHGKEHVITHDQTGDYNMRGWTASDFDAAVKTGYFNQFADSSYLGYGQLAPNVSTTFDQSQVINRLERVEDAILKTIEMNPEHDMRWDQGKKEMIYEIKTKTKLERRRRAGFRY